MDYLLTLAADPAAWAALVTLIVMEVVLGIDNLIFIAILTNKLPEEHRASARRIGIGGALILRLLLLGTIAIIVTLTAPILTILGKGFSWRDLILIAGGMFLVWKATKEIHHRVDPDPDPDAFGKVVGLSFAAAIVQILMLDLVFSIDSIITAVGMTPHVPDHGDRGRCCRADDDARGDATLELHRPQPDDRDAGSRLPADDRHDPCSRGLRRPRAQGLHLRGDGVLGGRRGPEHARPAGAAAPPGNRDPGKALRTALLSGERLHAEHGDVVHAFETDRGLVVGLGLVGSTEQAMNLAAVCKQIRALVEK